MEFVEPKNRYRLYFDETGTGDLGAAEKSEHERYLSVTGLVIRQDHHDGYLTRRLNSLKTLVSKNPQDLILHRREVMRREGEFRSLNDPEIHYEFDARLFAIVSECFAAAFTVSIDKLEHKRKYKVWQHSPYHYLIDCLLERYAIWLRKNSFVGDVLGEARNPTHDKRLRQAYRRTRRRGTRYASSTELQARILGAEIGLAEKAANVAGLQIADILAHPAHRYLRREVYREKHTDDFGTRLAELLNRRLYDRNSRGSIIGCGTKWLPKMPDLP